MNERINISDVTHGRPDIQASASTNIVELLGPPGAGKSTIYEHLVKKWTKKCGWNYHSNIRQNSPFEKFIRSVSKRKAGERIEIEKGMEFTRRYPGLADFIWTHLSDPRTYPAESIDKRLRAAYFTFKDFCRMQSLIGKCGGVPVIIDEGLLQRSFLLNADHDYMFENVSTYLDLVPLPAAVIVADTNETNVLFGRVRSRKKMIASHVGLDNLELYKDLENWQLLFRMITERLGAKGTTVLRIDAALPVERNAAIINEFLNSLTI